MESQFGCSILHFSGQIKRLGRKLTEWRSMTNNGSASPVYSMSECIETRRPIAPAQLERIDQHPYNN